MNQHTSLHSYQGSYPANDMILVYSI